MAFNSNMVLLLLGALATFTAFDGDACKKGSDPLIRRITLRGWISLCLTFITLGVGLKKELGDIEKDVNDQAFKDNQAKVIAQTSESLKDAEEQVKELHRQLETQGAITVIGMLANSGSAATGLKFEFDFKQKNKDYCAWCRTTFKGIVAYLAGDINDEALSKFGGWLHIDVQFLQSESYSSTDILSHDESDPYWGFVREEGDTFISLPKWDIAPAFVNPANLYALFKTRSIEVTFESSHSFNSKSQAEEYLANHPEIVARKPDCDDVQSHYYCTYALTPTERQTIKEWWGQRFKSVMVWTRFGNNNWVKMINKFDHFEQSDGDQFLQDLTFRISGSNEPHISIGDPMADAPDSVMRPF